ncbi:MAG: hypothetical protein ABR511_09825 [Acidimicrobiales bacterium]
MLALLVTETVAIVLLAVLVAGLLRSHAEILRALHDLGGGLDQPLPGGGAAARLATLPRTAVRADAFDVAGMAPGGGSVAVGVVGSDRDTLLAFLSTGCLTCTGFWQDLRSPQPAVPGGARLVVVTKGPEAESEASVADLAPPGAVTVMSSAAWRDYGIPVAPYFVYVRASGKVVGEGATTSWDRVATLLDRALADDEAALRRARAGVRSGRGELRTDLELAAAGIGPGDPSLYQAAVEAPSDRGEAPA